MTTYIEEPTDDQTRRWQDADHICIWCGSTQPDLDKCVCRYCDSCSRVWLAGVALDYRDEDYGPVSRWEECPECSPLLAENKTLKEEVARLQEHVKNLDSDLRGTITHCNRFHIDGGDR